MSKDLIEWEVEIPNTPGTYIDEPRHLAWLSHSLLPIWHNPGQRFKITAEPIYEAEIEISSKDVFDE